jgi:3',5'-cyclic AMP phosphodiesterase CpdA
LKLAIITDTHFGARNDNQYFSDFFYKFYNEIFFPTLEERDVTTCIHMGDVMDRRKYVSYKTATDFRTGFINKFEELGIDLHITIGNHDTYYKNTSEVNSMDELVGDRFKVYTEPKVVDFDGVPIVLMPWINANNYDKSMNILKTANADILMGHLEINGFAMNAGNMVCEGGWDRQEFKRFETVFSGHFHHKNDDGHIYYLGTPYEIYWSDFNDPKGFHIFDTETRELERIVNPFTMYKKVYYDDTQNDYSAHDVSQYKNHYVKLIVVNKKDLYGFDKFTDKLLAADAHEVKIIEDFSEFSADNVSDEIVENSEDTITLLERYVDDLNVDLDKKRLKNTMKALYQEAQDLEI